MKTDQCRRFIILIPHRDQGLTFRTYRRRLFAAGLAGAFSFPGAAPLAIVSRPYTAPELKALALSLRGLSVIDGGDGKIATGPAEAIAFPSEPAADTAADPGPPAMSSGPAIFGPVLDLPAPPYSAFPPDTLVYPFPRLVLCAALLGQQIFTEAALPEAPSLCFRAAALANLVLRPLAQDGYSFEWKIGVPRWLASYKPPKKGR
ncbi:MAG: hypothetical protein LBT13_03285 [Treponema sp.]|nr:hypothetical protein [Treponema sp.]